MKQLGMWMTLAAGVALGLAPSALAFGRGGRAYGGYRAGPYGGHAAGGYRSGAAVGPYGGHAYGARAGGTVVGPAGRSAGYRAGERTVTTPRGGTIEAGGAAVGRSGPLGGAAHGVGGVQVTTPGGRTATRVGTGGAAVGPAGNAVGGRTSVGAVGGYRGGAAGVSHHGTAIGPGGVAHGGYRGGVAVGPYGAAAGASRGAVAVGPGGAAAFHRGTYRVTGATLQRQGAYVRSGFHYHGAFTPAWYGRYPGVWRPVAWAAATAWIPATWATVSAYCGYPATPSYYDYGTTVVYEGDTVYVDGNDYGSPERYAQQATRVADAGRAKAPEKDEWQPLGVFALVGKGEQTSDKIFQLAINKDGLIRGNYYDAFADQTQPVYGSVDRKTQRAAWSIGEKKNVVLEAGIANLTRDETPVLIHYGTGDTRQLTLVRIERPEEKAGS